MSIRVLDLFCGGGGSSRGAWLAGADICCGVDRDPVAIQVYNSNFPGRGLVDIIDGHSASHVDYAAPYDMILASPECTHHTCARGNRPRDEASRNTAFHLLAYVDRFRPRWVIIENVVHMASWARYEELFSSLISRGYHVRPQVLDASDFGVPQARKRLFLLCDTEQMPPVVPPPMIEKHGAFSVLDPPGAWRVSLLDNGRRAKATLERAARARAALGEDQAFLLVYYGSDGAGGWQKLDQPLRTLTTLDRFALVEPSPDGHTMRMLQVPELARAMGFDPEWKMECGSRRDRVRILGNGVCPPVMERIIKTLQRNLARSPIATAGRLSVESCSRCHPYPAHAQPVLIHDTTSS